MPFKTFMGWIFDGNPKSEIPKPNPENGIPDILKYNSPITHTYVISLFVKCGVLNNYLDKHFNNINLRYINKSELFYYIKEQIYKHKIKRYQLYYSFKSRKSKLFEILREKCPQLKNCDISFLCEKIDTSNEKEDIYNSLGLIKPKKERIKKKKIERKSISLNEFLNQNFTIMDM